MLIRLLAPFFFLVVSPALAYGAEAESTIVMAELAVRPTTANAEISYSDFVAAVEAGEVTSVAIPPGQRSLDGVMTDGTAFSVLVPVDREFADRLVAAGIETAFTNVWKTDVFKTSPDVDPGKYLLWTLIDYAPAVIFLVALFLFAFLQYKGARRRDEQFSNRLIALLESSDSKLHELLAYIEKTKASKTPPNG